MITEWKLLADILIRIAPILLVVIGWVLAYRLQALQARRKSLRETAEKARESVEELLGVAIAFHTGNFDPEKQTIIHLNLKRIERLIELLPQIAQGRKIEHGMWRYQPDATDPKSVKIYPVHIVRLRQAITMEHFDGPHEPLSHNHTIITSIAFSGSLLIDEIHRAMVAALD